MFTLVQKLQALLVTLAVVVLTAAGGFWYGWSKRGDQEQVNRAALIIEYGKRIEKLSEKIVAIDEAKKEEARKYAEANDKYHAALRAGALRMSVPTRPSAGADPAAPGVPGQARTELDPEAAIRIDRIGIEGDQAIRDLNQCIDIYNEVRSQLNKGK